MGEGGLGLGDAKEWLQRDICLYVRIRSALVDAGLLYTSVHLGSGAPQYVARGVTFLQVLGEIMVT